MLETFLLVIVLPASIILNIILLNRGISYVKQTEQFTDIIKEYDNRQDNTLITLENMLSELKQIDLNDVEHGIHELRRKLRWIAIYSSCLLGKVKIEKNEKSDSLKIYVTKENINNKFNNLSKFKVDSPLYFTQGGFYAMNILIADIGDIKDKALTTEEFIQIGAWFKVPKNKIANVLGKDFISEIKVLNKTKELVNNFIVKEAILNNIVIHFENQI